MRLLLPICFAVTCITTTAQTSTQLIPTDTTETAGLLVGEWRFVHVLGPDGQPTDHIDRSQGPHGQTTRVNANGPDISIRTDRTYEMRFTPEHRDTGYWSMGSTGEVTYTLVVPMDSKQGEMLRFSAQMFNKTWPTDGKGNYLDSSTDKLVLLSKEEMRVADKGYVYVYRRN